jgi:outer membrane immunogenic protein
MGAALKVNRSFPIYTLALALLTVFAGGANSGARADDADLAQVLRTLKALESRVATLESEKQQYRREAASARAETQALKEKLGHQPGPASSPRLPPSGSYAMMTQTPIPPVVPRWGGLYAGASFGLTSQHANQDGVTSFTGSSIFTGPNFSSTNSNSETLTSSLGGRSVGAMANLYLGYDYMLPSNFLVGAEIEGGISNNRTTMNGTISGLTQSVSTNTNFGVSTTTTTPGIITGNTILNLDNRWVMSALARGGFLVDSKDLIYLVGGVTYGRFDLMDESFGTFGGTVGAGWERKITPSWTLKAEYRYTRFQDHTVTENAGSNSSGPGNSSSNDAIQTSRVSGLDWHTVTIGVSHYFDVN